MIEFKKNTFVATCDGCSFSEEEDHSGFYSEAVDYMKNNDWKISKKPWGWHHLCEDCAEDEILC